LQFELFDNYYNKQKQLRPAQTNRDLRTPVSTDSDFLDEIQMSLAKIANDSIYWKRGFSFVGVKAHAEIS
jgi:hypothetical protein